MAAVCLPVHLSVACLDVTREQKGLGTWKPKIGRMETHHTYFKVESSKVRVTKCKSIAASTCYVRVYMQREDIGTATLNSLAVPAWLLVLGGYIAGHAMVSKLI